MRKARVPTHPPYNLIAMTPYFCGTKPNGKISPLVGRFSSPQFDAQKQGELRVGDKITGRIISIGMDTVFVDTGSKIDGAVEKIELLAESLF